MRVVRSLITVIAVLIACISCVDESQRSVVMSDVDSELWSETATLYYENSDTLSKRTLSVALRFNADFQCDSLPLSMQVSLPDGRYAKERVSFVVERPYRSAAASTVVTLPYRKGVVLPLSGCYIFSLTSQLPLRGVEAIGVVVENEEQ